MQVEVTPVNGAEAGFVQPKLLNLDVQPEMLRALDMAAPAAFVGAELAEPGRLHQLANFATTAVAKVNELALKAHVAGSNRRHAMFEALSDRAHVGSGQGFEAVVHHIGPRILSLAGMVMSVRYGLDMSHLHTVTDQVPTAQLTVDHLPVDHLPVTPHVQVEHAVVTADTTVGNTADRPPVTATLDARMVPVHVDAHVPTAISKLAGELGYNSSNQGDLKYVSGDTVWQLFANLSKHKPAPTTALMQECAFNAHAAGDLKVVYPESGNANLYYYLVKVQGHWTGNTGDVMKVLANNSGGQLVYDGPAPSHDAAAGGGNSGNGAVSRTHLISELHLSSSSPANLAPNNHEYVSQLFDKIDTKNVPADTALMEQCASAAEKKGDLQVVTIGGDPSKFYYLVKIDGKWYSDTDHVSLVLAQHSNGLLTWNGNVETTAIINGSTGQAPITSVDSHLSPNIGASNLRPAVTVEAVTTGFDVPDAQVNAAHSLAMWIHIHGHKPVNDDLELVA